MDSAEALSREFGSIDPHDYGDDTAVQQAIWDTAVSRFSPSAPTLPSQENIDTETNNNDTQELQSRSAEDTAAIATPSARRTIDDCIHDIEQSTATSWDDVARLSMRDADTWVYIQPPPREPNQSDSLYNHVVERYSAPFRLRSRDLKASESAVILEQLDSPTRQFRAIRRFGVNKQSMSAQGIKYVLDLTPPVEGDDAVELIQELSCPPSVVQWVRTSQQWRVGSTMVGGFDELTPTSEQSMEMRPLVSDYSPLRHRMCIERVLALLHGRDVSFDSAPKLYTTVMVATKHLKIPSHRLDSLKGYVMGWARANPNSIIMEQHPEVMLKLAGELQLEQLCQDSFAILVGEAALAVCTRANSEITLNKNHSVHGRQHGLLDEIWQSRIEFARDILVERMMNAFFQTIAGGNMRWVEYLPVMKDIKARATSNGKKNLFESWLDKLKSYIRGALFSVIACRYSEVDTPSQGFRKSETFDRNLFRDTFNKLDFRERVMTRTFWKIIQDTTLTYQSRNAPNIHAYPARDRFTKDTSLGSESTIYALINTNVVVRLTIADLNSLTPILQARKEVDSLDGQEDAESVKTRVGEVLENHSRKKRRVSMPGAYDDSEGSLLDLPYRGKAESNGPLRITNPDTSSGSLNKDLSLAQTQKGNRSVLDDHQPVPACPSPHLQPAEAEISGVEAAASTERRGLQERTSVPQRLAGFNAVVFSNQENGTLAGNASSTFSNSSSETPAQSAQDLNIGEDSAVECSPRPASQAAEIYGDRPFAQEWTQWDLSGDLKQPVRSNVSTSGRILQETFSSLRAPWERITVDQVLSQAQDHIFTLASPFLAQPNSNTIELDTIDSLVCLQDTETKVLPLWAGGMDDGSGGVFNDEVPILDASEGFGPGRDDLRVGDRELGFARVGSSIAGSSANTSRLVNDGHSIIADRRQVYAASEIESVGGAPPSIASDSTWNHISTTHTPAESALGGLPPEVEEAPDFSDTGSVIYAASLGISEADDESEDKKGDVSMADREELADMFRVSDDDDFDEDQFENANSDEEMEDSDDNDDQMEDEYVILESEAERPGTAISEAYTAAEIPTKTSGETNPLYGYKAREETPLGFTSEAD